MFSRRTLLTGAGAVAVTTALPSMALAAMALTFLTGCASMRLIGRNRRRYGGYIVHFGVVILFCAFAGLMFKKDLTATLKARARMSSTLLSMAQDKRLTMPPRFLRS